MNIDYDVLLANPFLKHMLEVARRVSEAINHQEAVEIKTSITIHPAGEIAQSHYGAIGIFGVQPRFYSFADTLSAIEAELIAAAPKRLSQKERELAELKKLAEKHGCKLVEETI